MQLAGGSRRQSSDDDQNSEANEGRCDDEPIRHTGLSEFFFVHFRVGGDHLDHTHCRDDGTNAVCVDFETSKGTESEDCGFHENSPRARTGFQSSNVLGSLQLSLRDLIGGRLL